MLLFAASEGKSPSDMVFEEVQDHRGHWHFFHETPFVGGDEGDRRRHQAHEHGNAAVDPGVVVLGQLPERDGDENQQRQRGDQQDSETSHRPEGAKVFAAGAIDFGGTALLPAVSGMLENLWARLSVP